MKYILEPMLFAFEQDLTKERLVEYLQELLALDDWWDRHREDMFVQNTTSDALWATNYYPMAASLKPLMVKHGIDFIQYGDVNKIIEKMLSKSGRIDSLYEAVCGMKSQTLTRPMNVQLKMKRPLELHNELMKLLWHVFMAHVVGGYDEKSFVVITKGISDIVSIKYVYEELDEHYELKERIGSSEVNCKDLLEDFLNDTATPFLLWKTALRKDDLDLGIRVAVMQQKGELDMASVYENYDFVLQNSFYEDYCNGHYQSKDQDIRSTIQSVTDAVTEFNRSAANFSTALIFVTTEENPPPNLTRLSDYLTPYDVQFFAINFLENAPLTAKKKMYTSTLAEKLSGQSPILVKNLARLELYNHGLEFVRTLLPQFDERIFVRAVWECQMQFLMPTLEQIRERLIRKSETLLRRILPKQDEFGTILEEPLDMELRHLHYYGGKYKIFPAEDWELLEFAYAARNDLSHLKKLELWDLERLFAYAE